MPPNVTNSPTTTSGNNEQVRNRKGLINGQTDKTSNGTDKTNGQIKDAKQEQSRKSISILFKVLNFLFYLSLFLLIFVAAFIFLPWEEYIFDESEIENYIDMFTEGDGDWVVRQFLATAEQNLTEPILHETECYQPAYKMEKSFNAAPQTCGIVISDTLMSESENQRLRQLAQRITEEIGYQSYSNRESINLRWMNLHKLFRIQKERKNVLKEKDYELIKKASEQAKLLVSEAFGLPHEKLGFYLVTQFTRYRQVVPFSEFRHVDKVRSPGLVVTSILWLSTTDIDFGGGRTEFLVGGPEPFTPLMIEPKVGRFAAWTSGFENPHGVMGLHYGDRLALIFAFSVNPNIAYKTLDDLRNYAEQAKDIEY